MNARPPKRSLSAEQERAADAFVGAADLSPSMPPTTPRASRAQSGAADLHENIASRDLPWEAPHVRDDVVKGYALRLPEPLYLKLKWVAKQTGRSINGVCRDAIEADVEAHVARRSA